MSDYDYAYIRATCRWLRNNATPAEQRFWQLVRNRQILQKKFHRQYPIKFIDEGAPGFFVADFYCHECRLIVEIDGGIHEKQRQYDRLRTHIINELGIQVIRFSNSAALQKPQRVVRRLKTVLRQCEQNLDSED